MYTHIELSYIYRKRRYFNYPYSSIWILYWNYFL